MIDMAHGLLIDLHEAIRALSPRSDLVCVPSLLRDERFTGRFIEEYVDGYIFDGDESCHYPNESEKLLLLDCAVGLVTELLGGEFQEFCAKALATAEADKEEKT